MTTIVGKNVSNWGFFYNNNEGEQCLYLGLRLSKRRQDDVKLVFGLVLFGNTWKVIFLI